MSLRSVWRSVCQLSENSGLGPLGPLNRTKQFQNVLRLDQCHQAMMACLTCDLRTKANILPWIPRLTFPWWSVWFVQTRTHGAYCSQPLHITNRIDCCMPKWYHLVQGCPKTNCFADHNYYDRQAVCSYSRKSASVRKAGWTHKLQHIPSQQNASRYNTEHRTGSRTCERWVVAWVVACTTLF